MKREPKWSKVIRVDDDIYDWLKRNGRFGESYNDVLKRLLKIKDAKKEPER